MFIYALLLLTFTLALFSIFFTYTAAAALFRHNWSRLLAGLSLGVFIYLYGTWVYLTIEAKYGFGICLLLALIIGAMRRKKGQRASKNWQMVFNLFFTAILTLLSVLYFTGTTGKPETIELAFPMKTGRYFVLQGGKGLPTNLFHFSLRGAIYAMDIVKLKPDGRRANQIFSRKLADYEIFGDTLYSPCDGRVLKAYGDNPDNIPPDMSRGPNNTNQVIIETTNSYIFLGHMKEGSVIVHDGDVIKKGQP
ncbi:MAG: Peptidase, partial [Bacteroidetes bacterium]|nr:Peptidase [Bacteroidota bacterium]